MKNESFTETPVTNRQMMVLRFWAETERAAQGREQVTKWIDEWYLDDPARFKAWQLWKAENGDEGEQGNPERVPFGAGMIYLEKVKAAETEKRSAPLGKIIFWVVVFVLLVIWLKSR